MIPAHHLADLRVQLVDIGGAYLFWSRNPAGKCRRHVLYRCPLPRSDLRRVNAVFLGCSANVFSSRIASSATLALNSSEWFVLFFIPDRHFHHAIHLNQWSEFPRTPLYTRRDPKHPVPRTPTMRSSGRTIGCCSQSFADCHTAYRVRLRCK